MTGQQLAMIDRGARVPWYLKIALKIVLSRIPLNRTFWNRLGVFRHGRMKDPPYAFAVFMKHFHRAGLASDRRGFVALELGPGDSLFSALSVYSLGGSETYLIDIAPFATRDIGAYRHMAEFLSSKELRVPDLDSALSLEQVLETCGAHYGTAGLDSLRSVPSGSVDLIWSQSVLQHMRRDEFPDIISETRRVIRPNGICSHSVDLKDCLGGRLNNLRLPERLWERNFMAGSGFYTNRVRFSEMLRLFEQAGFETEILSVERWEEVPTPKSRLAAEFKALPDEELMVSAFDVLLRPV